MDECVREDSLPWALWRTKRKARKEHVECQRSFVIRTRSSQSRISRYREGNEILPLCAVQQLSLDIVLHLALLSVDCGRRKRGEREGKAEKRASDELAFFAFEKKIELTLRVGYVRGLSVLRDLQHLVDVKED